uniref:Uncharacterized protein n=1 Tax=Ditylenchus dipsaci TaxID=166011 RepID=A0A915ES92_9BILA
VIQLDFHQTLALGIYTDKSGMMRSRTRLQYSKLSREAKEPIFLPTESLLTKLIVLDFHLRLLHGGPVLVLSHLRRNFLLPKGVRQWLE